MHLRATSSYSPSRWVVTGIPVPPDDARVPVTRDNVRTAVLIYVEYVIAVLALLGISKINPEPPPAEYGAFPKQPSAKYRVNQHAEQPVCDAELRNQLSDFNRDDGTNVDG